MRPLAERRIGYLFVLHWLEAGVIEPLSVRIDVREYLHESGLE